VKNLLETILRNKPRKPVPGFSFFACDECGETMQIATRDCLSPSGEHCGCGEFLHPNGCEEHPEWPADSCGNLLEES
jgi:hypothetical protein